jgi:hypothetical protein
MPEISLGKMPIYQTVEAKGGKEMREVSTDETLKL